MSAFSYQTQCFPLLLPPTSLTDLDLIHIQQHTGLTPEQLTTLKVAVVASWPKPASVPHSNFQPSRPSLGLISNGRLWLSYYLSVLDNPKAKDHLTRPTIEQLGWYSFDSNKVQFIDYLWQHTCLECFIGGKSSEYIEINANPQGPFALYHFDDYRTPDIMPPPPLLLNPMKGSKQQRAYIEWQPHIASLPHNSTTVRDVYNSLSTLSQSHSNTISSRHFSIELTQLPTSILPLSQIHPCVIVRVADRPLYFAATHANPPDFHDRQNWTSLS